MSVVQPLNKLENISRGEHLLVRMSQALCGLAHMAGLLSGTDVSVAFGYHGSELQKHFQEAAVLAKKHRNPLVAG